MWSITVSGDRREIYRKLKTEFDNQVVEKEQYSFDVTNPRTKQTMTYQKERAVIDDQTSIQFRNILKFIQVLALESFGDGLYHVSLRGEPGKSIEVKVEVA